MRGRCRMRTRCSTRGAAGADLSGAGERATSWGSRPCASGRRMADGNASIMAFRFGLGSARPAPNRWGFPQVCPKFCVLHFISEFVILRHRVWYWGVEGLQRAFCSWRCVCRLAWAKLVCSRLLGSPRRRGVPEVRVRWRFGYTGVGPCSRVRVGRCSGLRLWVLLRLCRSRRMYARIRQIGRAHV